MKNNTLTLKPLIFFISLMLGLLNPILSTAQIYKWVDQNGKLHLSDKPPKNIKAQTLNIPKSKKRSPQQDKSKPKNQPEAENKPVKVVMYSTQWCGYCKIARQYFQDNKISFKEYDTETSARGKLGYKKLKGTGVPIILINKQRMNGFSAQSFGKIYAYEQKR